MKKTDTKRLVMTAFLVVIVVVLQYMGSFIHLGTFSISLVLVPIVIGAALYGPAAAHFWALYLVLLCLYPATPPGSWL